MIDTERAEHADHPSAFIAFNQDVRHYVRDGVPGLIAYRLRGRSAVMFGGVLAAPEHTEPLLDGFLAWCAGRRLRVVVVQIRPDQCAVFAARGFTVDQLGSSYSIDLARFSLQGRSLAKIRQNTARAAREQVVVREVGPAEHAAELDAIDDEWLRAKGRHARQLHFMVGERGGRGEPHRRLFGAWQDARLVGYITYSPAWGVRPGWLYDLTRRRPDAPVGTIELINLTALRVFAGEGARWLHLGLTPFAGLDARHAVPDARNALVEKIVRLIAEHGTFLYSATSQESFKLKWAPHSIEPEYLAFQRRPTVAALWQLFKLTNAI